MTAWHTLVAFSLLCGAAVAIECYTGWTYIKGQPIATGQEKCSQKSHCYNLTLDSDIPTTGVKKAGCSNWRCTIARNGCHSYTIGGQKVTFCCCNDRDKCNSKYSQLGIMDRIKEGTKDAKTVLDDILKKLENPFGRK